MASDTTADQRALTDEQTPALGAARGASAAERLATSSVANPRRIRL